MSYISAQAFADFDAMAGLFGRTRLVLDDIMWQRDVRPSAATLLSSETLPHIEGVEAGFKARLRSSEGDLAELRGLVLQGGLAMPEPRDGAEARAALIEAMQALSGAGGPRELMAPVGRELAALEHARIALAMLPRTEAADVRYRGRHSYADIVAPRSPAELASRIEEVERTIWQVAAGRAPDPAASAWRRVYAFFDAGERLSMAGLASS